MTSLCSEKQWSEPILITFTHTWHWRAQQSKGFTASHSISFLHPSGQQSTFHQRSRTSWITSLSSITHLYVYNSNHRQPIASREHHVHEQTWSSFCWMSVEDATAVTMNSKWPGPNTSHDAGFSRPSVQYNAHMESTISTDGPRPTHRSLRRRDSCRNETNRLSGSISSEGNYSNSTQLLLVCYMSIAQQTKLHFPLELHLVYANDAEPTWRAWNSERGGLDLLFLPRGFLLSNSKPNNGELGLNKSQCVVFGDWRACYPLICGLNFRSPRSNCFCADRHKYRIEHVDSHVTCETMCSVWYSCRSTMPKLCLREICILYSSGLGFLRTCSMLYENNARV